MSARVTATMNGYVCFAGLSLLGSATACSANVDANGEFEGGAGLEDVSSLEAALTTQERVLGFETPLGWSTSAGLIDASTTRSQGATSLRLRNANYAELTSQVLSTLSGVGPELAFDVRPPAVAGWGQIQVYASSATLGWNSYQWLGQVSVAGLAAGQFHQLKVTLPANVQAKLSQSYSDLRIRLAMNAPASSTGWLIDNLRFAGSTTPDCGAGSPYTLTLINATGVDPTHLQNLRCRFFQVYPQLAARFNPSATTNVTFSFVETGDYPAWADSNGGIIYLNKQFLAANPADADVIVHEGMHIVQAGYSGQVEGWIIEGTADYVRELYGQDTGTTWSIPSGWEAGQHFTGGYGTTAAFFLWIDANYRQNQTPVADALDDILRAGSYSDATWVSLTGQSVTSLWYLYSGNQAPQPAASGVTLYRDGDFTGWSFRVGPGSYDATALGSRGLQDAISSLRVPAGYRVTAYEHTGNQGASIQFTSDTSYVGNGWNDIISSIVVEQL